MYRKKNIYGFFFLGYYGHIEDDSYIFYNFGYHLFKSEQFHLFPVIYLDLAFVEAMLKATSSVDLLNDYRRYGDQIIGQVKAIIFSLLGFFFVKSIHINIFSEWGILGGFGGLRVLRSHGWSLGVHHVPRGHYSIGLEWACRVGSLQSR